MGGNAVYLYVTPFFPSPTSWRGSYCLDFVRALQREVEVEGGGGEWNVLVFVPGAGKDYEIEGVKVYRFPTRQLPSNIFPFLFRRYNERSFLNKVKEVLDSTVNLNLQPQPQILTSVKICHSHTANCVIYALAAKRTFGCTALLHHHDPQSFGLNLGILRHCAIYNAWLFCRMRKLFEQIDCHVFISEMVKRSFLSAPDASWTTYENYRRQMRCPRFFHCRPARIKRSLILHNGVDTSIFKEEGRGKKEEVRTDSNPFVIGCIGNFIDWKDQETLIRAMALVAGGAPFVTGVDEAPFSSNWYDVAENVICDLKSIRIILADAALCDRRAVKDVFKSFGLVENAFDGRKVSFPSKSVGKMLGQRGIDLYRVAGSFAEIFRSSRRAWSETEAMIENHKEHRNIGAYHQYIAKFNDGREEWLVRFTVREERGGRIARNEVHSSTVSRITVYKAKGVELSNLGHAQAEDSTPFVDNKIAYYLARVNGVEDGKRGERESRDERVGGQRNFRVVFVGSGPTLERCKRLAAETESKVNQSTLQLQLSTSTKLTFTFKSEVSHAKLADFYHSLDLFVLPSYFEGFGCVFTEAYASGVPFITCKGQGMDDLVREDERNLWSCNPRDAEDLAEKIAHYIAHRPVQHLSEPISFDVLIPRFVKELGL